MKLVSVLLENLTLLVVMLPLVGAWLVLGVSQLGVETARRTALMNVCFSALLAVLLFTNYDPRQTRGGTVEVPVRIQMQTRMRWTGSTIRVRETNTAGDSTDPASDSDRLRLGPDVRLAFGVDGISLGFVVLTSLVMVPVMFSAGERTWKHPAIFYALLLMLQSSLLGLFAAQDLIVLFCCLEFSLLLLFFLTGWWGEAERKQTAGKWFVYQHAGHLLLLLAFVGMVISLFWIWKLRGLEFPLSFRISDVLNGIAYARLSESSLEYWQNVGPGILACLLLGVTLLFPVLPWHGWVVPAMQNAPAPAKILLFAIRINVGGYLLTRFALPLGIPLLTSSAGNVLDWLWLVMLISAVVFAMLSLVQPSLEKFLAFACLTHFAIAGTGFASLTHSGIQGGLCYLLQLGLLSTALLLLLDALQRRFPSLTSEFLGGLSSRYPRLGGCLFAALLMLIAIPGSGGFASLILILSGGFSSQGSLFWQLAALLILAGATLGVIQWLLRGPFYHHGFTPDERDELRRVASRFGLPVGNREFREVIEATPPEDLSVRELMTVVPCLLLVLMLGLFPQTLLSRMDRDVQRIAIPYQEHTRQSTTQAEPHSTFNSAALFNKD